MRPVNRIQPRLPAQAVKTYEVRAPLATHWRRATCTEVNCPHQAHGWRSIIDESTPLGQQQANFIRCDSGRSYREHRDEAGLTVFTFPPGQTCFTQHRAPTGRPELYVVRDGDWRGNPRRTTPRLHTRPEDWVDDFATHQDQLARRLAQG